MNFVFSRKELEQIEIDQLAPYACKSRKSRGRKHEEKGDPDPWRTAYQRDVGRIIHCFSFRRLQYKTQVFVTHEGDFYRTRLTHTFAVVQLAQTLARALKVNEDLTQAIALAHDIGHPPFGHAGEEELLELMRDHGGFEHNMQALRTVDEIETHSPGFRGLNLTYETREGLVKHRTEYDNPTIPSEFDPGSAAPIEAQIVNIVDEVAFRTHDLEDALWMRLVKEKDLDKASLPIWDKCKEEILKQVGTKLTENDLRTKLIVKKLIDVMLRDIIDQTIMFIKKHNVGSVEKIRKVGKELVKMTPELEQKSKELGNFLNSTGYHHPTIMKMVRKGRMIIRSLCNEYMCEPKLLPKEIQTHIDDQPLARIVSDYIAGMTDRYAMDQYRILFEPYVRAGIDPSAIE